MVRDQPEELKLLPTPDNIDNLIKELQHDNERGRKFIEGSNSVIENGRIIAPSKIKTLISRREKELSTEIIDSLRSKYKKNTSNKTIMESDEYKDMYKKKRESDDYLLGMSSSLRVKKDIILRDEEIKMLETAKSHLRSLNSQRKQIEDKIKEEQKIALETYKSIYDIDEDVKIKLTKDMIEKLIEEGYIDPKDLADLYGKLNDINEQIKNKEDEIINKKIVIPPEYHEIQVSEKIKHTIKNEPIIDNFINNVINDNEEYENIYYTQLEGSEDRLKYVGDINKPEAFNDTTIERLKLELGQKGKDIFELQTTNYDNIKHIIKDLDPSFKIEDITKAYIFNTNYDIYYNKTLNTYDTKPFNGASMIFKGDENSPLDIIAFLIDKNNKTQKYAIENKYYNENNQYIGVKGSSTKSGKAVLYQDIINLNNTEYNEYKTNLLIKYNDLLDPYEYYTDDNIPDLSEEEKLKYERYKEIKNILNDNNVLTESFYRDVYTTYIPIKLSKTSFRGSREPHKTHTEDVSSYTKQGWYDYKEKGIHSNFFRKQKFIHFNNNGTIESIKLHNGNDVKFGDLKLTDVFKDAKVLYMISYKDALLGMNWSSKLQENPELVIDPLYRYKPTRSAYGYETDSLGLTFRDFKVLTRQDQRKPIKAKKQGNITMSNNNKILDV